MDSTYLIGILSSSFGFLSFYLLIVHSRKHKDFTHILLAIIIFSLSWILLVTTFNVTGFSLTFPHLFRTGLPLSFLILPSSYLYVRIFFREDRKFKPVYLLHFVPAAILLIDILPFIFTATDKKIAYIQQYLNNPNSILTTIQEGIITPTWIFWLLVIIALVYLGLQLRILYQYTNRKNAHYTTLITNRQFKWLIYLTVSALLFILPLVWILISSSAQANAYYVFSISLGAVFLLFIFLLYHKPELLYGLPAPNRASTHDRRQYSPFDDTQLSSYAEKILQYINDHKPYLQSGYSLEDLSQDTDIGRHHLSIVINKGLGMKFNELINRSRIEYLVQHYSEVNKHNHLTIEGVASSVGFNSRTTFLHSVKRFTGLTPTEFIGRLKANTEDIQPNHNGKKK